MIERICTRRMFALLLAAAAVMTSLPAYAEGCGTRQDVVAKLQSGFHEQLTGGGLHDEGAVVEVWASPETGTFTVISTDAEGRSCVLATGTEWHQSQVVTKASAQKL